MDTGCGCFGIAASSRRPVKRYNELVPDCFPREPPPVTQSPDAAQERKYKKLCEYLDNNPDRIPKASRRLARAVNKHLVSRKHGFVSLAAQTYIYLLDRLKPVDSSLLAKELILEHVAKAPTPVRAPGVPEGTAHPHVYSVVGLLLTQRNQDLRVQGLQLLTHFIDAQDDAATVQEFMVRVKAGSSQPASGAVTPLMGSPGHPVQEQLMAQEAFTALAYLIKNAAVGDEIILAALQFLWQRGAWQEAGPEQHLRTLIVSTIGQVCLETQQSFLLFQLLLRQCRDHPAFP
ncbi:hypothetical protein WJX84_011951 [Apatococcus fuscideae]|uniref:Uncharacterized protein n=1 Tax=Apatococcus fuscideae TaxID=2026836 RepID=A0AAW1T0P1_9CHLO